MKIWHRFKVLGAGRVLSTLRFHNPPEILSALLTKLWLQWLVMDIGPRLLVIRGELQDAESEQMWTSPRDKTVAVNKNESSSVITMNVRASLSVKALLHILTELIYFVLYMHQQMPWCFLLLMSSHFMLWILAVYLAVAHVLWFVRREYTCLWNLKTRPSRHLMLLRLSPSQHLRGASKLLPWPG